MKQPSVISVRIVTKNEPILSTKLSENFIIMWKYNILPKLKIMNIKRLFGALLTILGIAGLIYTAYVFTDTTGSERDIKTLIIYGVLGFVYFISGIGLVKTTKDES